MPENNHIGVYLKLHKKNDAPVIEKLEEEENKQGYIKGLILEDIKNDNSKGNK